VRAASRTDLETARRGRRGLAIYFAIVVALSGVIQAVIISRPDLDGLIAGLMLVPTIASVVARLALKEGFSDVSFRFGGRKGAKAIVQALIFPLLIGLLAYVIAWTTGLARFDPPPLGALIAVFAGGIVVSLVVVSGEEIGWHAHASHRLWRAPSSFRERTHLGSVARAARNGGRVRGGFLAADLCRAAGCWDHGVRLRDCAHAARDGQRLAGDRAAHCLEQHHHKGVRSSDDG
jgi:hypothetical protein